MQLSFQFRSAKCYSLGYPLRGFHSLFLHEGLKSSWTRSGLNAFYGKQLYSLHTYSISCVYYNEFTANQVVHRSIESFGKSVGYNFGRLYCGFDQRTGW